MNEQLALRFKQGLGSYDRTTREDLAQTRERLDAQERRAEAAHREEAERQAAAERLAKLAPVWVQIAGGTFKMGSASGGRGSYAKRPDYKSSAAGALHVLKVRRSQRRLWRITRRYERDERPVHTVRVGSFELMQSEVTVGQYRQCVEAGACTAPDAYDPSEGGVDKYCNWGQSGREDHPVNCVDWDQAQSFASWAGGRLPTEAEWEYAARSGGESWPYPWGNEEPTCSLAIMIGGGSWGCGQDGTWPVCSKPAGSSSQGVCDLSGNVWEGVQDTHQDSYRGAPDDGTAWEDGVWRVNRGGSWFDTAAELRASCRDAEDPSHRSFSMGFRLARDAP